jgi:hypothetical protein
MHNPQKKLFFGNRQPHLPNVERNRPPQDTCLLLQEIYRPPSNNPTRNTEVTCSAHLQTYGSVFFVLCSLCFIVFCIVIFQFDCFHCIERVWCFIVLNECLRPQTVLRLVAFWSKTLRFGQKRFKINFDHKRKTFSFVTAKRKTVQKPELESAPQRETQTQQRAWFSWHGVARGAVRDSHTRRRHGTRAVR